jgi:hypothetical protein
MTERDLHRRLREIVWPAPSNDLRARIVSTSPAIRCRVTWSDRVWFSRTWRVAGVAAFVLLIAIEPLSERFRSTGSARTTPPATSSEAARAIREAAPQLGLPADVTASLEQRTMARAANADATDARLLALQLRDLDLERERP